MHGRGQESTKCQAQFLMVRDHLGNYSADDNQILQWILRETRSEVVMYFNMGPQGLLQIQIQLVEISRPSTMPSQKGLCFIELGITLQNVTNSYIQNIIMTVRVCIL
jgi:hypothetical protein